MSHLAMQNVLEITLISAVQRWNQRAYRQPVVVAHVAAFKVQLGGVVLDQNLLKVVVKLAVAFLDEFPSRVDSGAFKRSHAGSVARVSRIRKFAPDSTSGALCAPCAPGGRVSRPARAVFHKLSHHEHDASTQFTEHSSP